MDNYHVPPGFKFSLGQFKEIVVLCCSLLFLSFAFSWTPDFKREFPASTATFKSSVQPERQLCRYDLHGTCNDADCPWYVCGGGGG